MDTEDPKPATRGKTEAQAARKARPPAKKATGAGSAAKPQRAKPVRPAKLVTVAGSDAAAVAPAVPVRGSTMRKKELVERVVAVSGARKKDVRDIVEAVLTVLGDALHGGEVLALPPFGKARVNRQKDTAGGETLVVKLRRGGGGGAGAGGAAKAPKETLAEDTE